MRVGWRAGGGRGGTIFAVATVQGVLKAAPFEKETARGVLNA